MHRRARILVVDDDVSSRTAVAELLDDEEYDVESAADAFKALGKLDAFSPHVVITDLKMPGMDGIELVKRLAAQAEPPAVIVMTAYGAVATAIEALRAGAEEYLTKPLIFDELLVVLERVLAKQALDIELREMRRRISDRHAPSNLVGASPAMHRVYELVDHVGPTRATVLITGESGTGKELVANALHQRSPRADKPFVKVHCAAFAESLLESELFGHERGALAGATTRRDGRLSLADGGTLFLDEVGEISPAIQAKLLRFLQKHELERVGSSETLRVDVRIIAATNRNLAADVAAGRFHEGLYFTLNFVDIQLPPLRDRRSDIIALASSFVVKYAKANDKPMALSPQTLDVLTTHDWPGNVRELENAIEGAVTVATGRILEPHFLPEHVRRGRPSNGAPPIPGSTLEAIERYAILETLKLVGGSTAKAAAMLGISARTIQYRLQAYNADVNANKPK